MAYCHPCFKEWTLKYKYGITRSEYAEMLAKQGGGCAICAVAVSQAWSAEWDRPLEIDHCHSTGRVRGLLCNRCNRLLGMVEDDPALLRRAADYLEATASV